ncbi:MAG: putative glycolipid-binding domain-containing protein [Bosea sp. (in: a-proteobacteria)]
MSFRDVALLAEPRSLRWRSVDGDSLEHLVLQRTATGIRAESVMVDASGAGTRGIAYAVDCTPDFTVTGFSLSTTDGQRPALARRDGRWRRRDGELPGFDECADIDMSGTPFTNTLPIRRESWQPGQSRTITTLYIPFDDFAPRIDRQIYTCLSPRLFRYQSADGSFEAEISVDDDGLVFDYPSLFARI